MAKIYRVLREELDKLLDIMRSYFDQQDIRFEESMEKNKNNQCQARLQYQAHQPPLAAMADANQDRKTREREEDVAIDERLGDISSVRFDDPISQTSLGDSAEPSEAPEKNNGNALVDEGTEAPKPWLSLVEMSTSTTASGLLHADSALTKCSDDALVNEGAEAPKPRLSTVKTRKTPAGGLLRAGSVSNYKAQGTNVPPQPLRVIFVRQYAKHSTCINVPFT